MVLHEEPGARSIFLILVLLRMLRVGGGAASASAAAGAAAAVTMVAAASKVFNAVGCSAASAAAAAAGCDCQFALYMDGHPTQVSLFARGSIPLIVLRVLKKKQRLLHLRLYFVPGMYFFQRFPAPCRHRLPTHLYRCAR